MRSFILRLALLHPASSNNRGRRTGQALLLAVLLMVFAAIIGTTFITVVALNMDATATQEERQRAASAAAAGAQVVNYQINANGTDWRPEQVSPPPAAYWPDGSVNNQYSYYWTAQDLAHGYARSTPYPTTDLDGDGQIYSQANPDYEDDWLALEAGKAAGQPVFVKFPDPRLEQNTGSHTYMTEVATATTLDGTDKNGMLRITVVGQSSDDPNVLVKRVGYKGTSENGGAFAWDQFLTNWNYSDQKNIQTTTTAAVAVASTTITVNGGAGFAPGRLITIQHPTTPNIVENAQVRSIVGNTITLRSPVINAYTAGALVRGASPVMNGLIGYEGLALGEQTQFNAEGRTTAGQPASDTWETTQNQYRGIGYGLFSNSDVQLVGKANFVLASTQSKINVAGTILPAVNPTPIVHARFDDGSANGIAFPTSFDATYPVQGASLIGQQRQVNDRPSPSQVDDPTQTTRNVRSQQPPDLTNFPRLLEMTKYSPRGVEGLGAGVYINNGQDVEKVAEGGAPRAINVSDMQRLWMGKSFPALSNGNSIHGDTAGVGTGTTGHRLSYPRITPGTDSYIYPLAAGSLEQRGIRGWINTYEFVPRGAQITIQPNQIIITLDDRSDSVANLPDPNKTWPYARNNGLSNCYRMTIDTSTGATNNQRAFGALGYEVTGPTPTDKFNGVIYAEGNVRVRGQAGNTDLTIVSMNNIYIEGNLVQSGTGRIALLAHKNVTLNPTQFTSHVSGSQDRDVVTQPIPVTATNVGTGADATNRLMVSSINTFREGDYIRVGSDTTWRQVVQKLPVGTPDGLVLKPALAAAATVGNAITIKSVAATITAASTGNALAVSDATPFRFGDAIRVGLNNWVKVIAIDTTTNTLTVSANVPAVTNDSIQILSDPDFVPGANPPAPYPALWPSASVPTGSTTGDNFESPEWQYRLSSPRDVLARDIRFDGVSPGAAAGSGYQLSTRMVGERKLAYKLSLESDPPTAGAHTVRISENNNPANTVIEPAELRFTALGPAATPPDEPYTFDYNLLDVLTPSGTVGDDATQTMKALLDTFNAQQIYPDPAGPPAPDIQKWELTLGTATTPSNVNMDANESQAIPARYLLPLGITNGLADDWTANRTDPKRLYVSTAARQYVGGTLDYSSASFYKFGASSSSTTSDNDLATLDPNFYHYNFVSGGTTYERQQWLRWSNRAMSSASNTDNIVAVTMENSVTGGTAALAPLRAAGFKFEREGFDAAGAYNPVEITVQATVFAQEGSWFAIPAPLQHRNDLNNNGNNFDAAEISYATRMRRPNYKINVRSRIVQNFAPTALTDYDLEESPNGSTNGAIAQWADSLSHPANLVALSGIRGRDWNTINYQTETQIPVNSKLILPPSPELSFAG